MIEFSWGKYDKKTNNPILKDKDIDEFAELILNDYKPNLLKEPKKINYMHFLESYFGVNLEFQYIYYEENERPKLGATAFNNGLLKIFDREDMCIRNILIKEHTVIIDSSIMEESKESLVLFTALHEAGHFWMHKGVYKKCNEQLSMFNNINPVICCRTNSIENFGSKKRLITADDWREHQADYFASAIAMPKSTFIPLANKILNEKGISDGKVVIGIDAKQDAFAENEFPNLIAKAYGVSKKAAKIKLKNFGFIIEKGDILKYGNQLTLL